MNKYYTIKYTTCSAIHTSARFGDKFNDRDEAIRQILSEGYRMSTIYEDGKPVERYVRYDATTGFEYTAKIIEVG